MNNEVRQTIDLRHKEDGTIDYEIQKFPDGELHFVLKSQLDHKRPVFIDTRITCADELFILMQVLDICNRHGMNPSVSIFYLMGARMDRIMDFNRPFTLNIIKNTLSQFNARFEALAPHNPDALGWGDWENLFGIDREAVACFPDKGAYERYYRHYPANEKIMCSKKRDAETGKLTGFELDLNGVDISGKDVYVIDDLCDGGGTFCGIAPLIRKHNPKSLSLSVVHCIQKSGILKVAELYDNVYITNSYRDWQNEDLPENVKISIL